MPSRQHQPSIQPIPVTPVLTTIFHQLPQSHQQQLAHLIADLIRHVRTRRVRQEHDTVSVELRPCNDRQYNRDLMALCERGNALAPHLPDGRRLHFSAQVNAVVRPILDMQKRQVA